MGVAAVCVGLLGTTTATAGTVDSGGGSAEPSDGATTTGSSAAPGSTKDLAAPQTSSEGVEVVTYGTAEVAVDMNSELSPVYQAVHAVRRTPDRTVVYWSVGWAEEPEFRSFAAFGRRPFALAVFDTYSSAPFVNIALPQQGQFLYGVPDPTFNLVRAATSDREALPTEPGVMGVMYTVLPPLPEDVDTVDVTLGFADVVTGVPVEDGLLEPTVEGPVVPLGTGWPEIPEALLAPVEAPGFSTRPLFSPSEDIDGFSREAEAGEQVTIDIAADVLFAFDSADLSQEAVARLDELAQELLERAAPGELAIVGHTDDNGPDDYNQELSQRRAQSVADVLQPALADAELDLVVEGRGEAEPVADNSTEEGQQLNRRVTVSFTEIEED
ncbi:OmpA family protein [Jannaschia sp. R86511]|uniref:OmpA family protein n=1 Tax=Jannaschia sp. R86511 TaxID=3093853 RepID=UPI0036D3B34B